MKSGWDQSIQYQPQETIQTFQYKQLEELLLYLQANSPFYRKMFAENKSDISGIKSLEDLQHLPFTTRADLQARNKDFLCIPVEDAIDFVRVPGIQGEQVILGLTENDLERLIYNEKLSFQTLGLTPEDILQVMTDNNDQFMYGIACFGGARRLGIPVCRSGKAIPRMQWELLRRLGSTVAISDPSFVFQMAEFVRQELIESEKSSLQKWIIQGRSLRQKDLNFNSFGDKILNEWKNIQPFSVFFSVEAQASFSDCEAGIGAHLQPELAIAEFIDAEGNPVPSGEEGELVITSLRIEGTPLLRFRTGEMVTHYTESCACGRNTVRITGFGCTKQNDPC